MTLAGHAAAGRQPEFERHLADALRSEPGILAAVRELVFQIVPYCGWAVALNSVSVIRQVLAEVGLPPPSSDSPLEERNRQDLRSLGHATARTVNPLFEKVAVSLKDFDPDLLDYLVETAYGYMYNRPGLDLVTRELLAVAVLAAVGQEPQLRYHRDGARNVGASAEAIDEAARIGRGEA